MPATALRLPLFILLGFAALSLPSCKPLYLPNNLNTPMLSNAGSVNINAAVGTSMVDVQAAMSPVEHLGIMANIAWSAPDSSTDRNFLAEGGLGYYKMVGDNFHFDVYGGMGAGSSQQSESSFGSTTAAAGRYLRFFAQPGIGMKSQVVEFGLASRFSIVQMTGTGPSAGFKSMGLFIEPAATLKVGWRFLKFYSQLGVSIPAIRPTFEWNPFIFGMGVNVNFGTDWNSLDE